MLCIHHAFNSLYHKTGKVGSLFLSICRHKKSGPAFRHSPLCNITSSFPLTESRLQFERYGPHIKQGSRKEPSLGFNPVRFRQAFSLQYRSIISGQTVLKSAHCFVKHSSRAGDIDSLKPCPALAEHGSVVEPQPGLIHNSVLQLRFGQT